MPLKRCYQDGKIGWTYDGLELCFLDKEDLRKYVRDRFINGYRDDGVMGFREFVELMQISEELSEPETITRRKAGFTYKDDKEVQNFRKKLKQLETVRSSLLSSKNKSSKIELKKINKQIDRIQKQFDSYVQKLASEDNKRVIKRKRK